MSKETKFTKGEWIINGKYLALETGRMIVKVWTGFSMTSEDKANLNLIKTAPKLYVMLEDLSCLMVMLDDQTHPNIELDAVKHDIDKLLAEARGEQ